VTRNGLLGDVYFAFDRAELSEESRSRLSRNAEWLRAHPEFEVRIEGHCDERGTNEYNLALGERRAAAARDYLISLGVSASKLTTISATAKSVRSAASRARAAGRAIGERIS
jgi:peptidoglycan-associated lipoprotein